MNLLLSIWVHIETCVATRDGGLVLFLVFAYADTVFFSPTDAKLNKIAGYSIYVRS